MQLLKNYGEITFRAMLLAVILTAILAASNVYLALKLGNTIAASIPAAVLSMSILRFFKGNSILESNLVQTSASAGEGVAAAVSFILPALIIIGFWKYFHYWQTVLMIFVGGMLGLFFSIPLRKLLINDKDLTFPEGTAVGNIMKASIDKLTNSWLLISGGLTGAAISLFQTGFKIISDSWQLWFLRGHLLTGIGLGFSPALLAAGYIVGMQASIGMLLGLFLGWIIGIPVANMIYPTSLNHLSAYDLAMQLWSQHIRFVGVGTMLLGGAWTLLLMIKPIYYSLKLSFTSMTRLNEAERCALRKDQDIPIKYVACGVAVFTVLVLISVFYFLGNQAVGFSIATRFGLSLFAGFFIIIGGFFLASISGYLSGLVGMTNNPLSGLMLISVLTISFLLSLAYLLNPPAQFNGAIIFVILVTAIVAIIAAISGENMQDLKAGQIVNATPWKQQFMIIIGVITASFVVAPILELLFQAYGIAGIFPRPQMDHSQMLPAPQATLMTAIAEGVFGRNLPWSAILVGMLIAVIGIIIDEYGKQYNRRLPILAIGLGIYLPPDIIVPVVIGGLINYTVKKRIGKQNKQGQESSILLACGIVAGSALMGVILAVPFVIAGNSEVLRITHNIPLANILGLVSTLLLCVWLYTAAKI
jgi:putative OPT family oligopeptide transporter